MSRPVVRRRSTGRRRLGALRRSVADARSPQSRRCSRSGSATRIRADAGLLAAYVANRKLDGDPVWLMLVGGSGVGKTERLIPLAVMPDVVLESSITGPAALLSGTGKKERAKDATGGLLRKLPEGGGVLLLKDFTSIIDMHRESHARKCWRRCARSTTVDGIESWAPRVDARLTWTGQVGTRGRMHDGDRLRA